MRFVIPEDKNGQCHICGAEMVTLRAYGDEFVICSRDPKHSGWNFPPVKKRSEKKMSDAELKKLWKDMNEEEDELSRLVPYLGYNWVREELIQTVRNALMDLQDEFERECEKRGVSWNELATYCDELCKKEE